MPKHKTFTPKYRNFKASGQGVVTVAGRDFYLGPHVTNVSRIEYNRFVAEWLAVGRSTRGFDQTDALSVIELIRAYWRFVRRYDRKNGKSSGEQGTIRASLPSSKHVMKTWGE